MILIAGLDGTVLELLEGALTAAARPHRRVDDLDFQTAWEARATTLVLIEELPRFYADAAPRGGGLAEVVRAASAPSVRRVIVATARPDDDPLLRELRRSGAPYVILRPVPLLDAMHGASSGDRIMVPRSIAQSRASALPVQALVDAVLDALDAPVVGRTLTVEPNPETTWAQVLEQAGAQPRVVAAWGARLARWFGVNVLDGAQPVGAA
jgi:hypothetical protein